MPIADRASFIELLKRLEGDDDRDVVAAAREIARRMKEDGATWEDVVAKPDGAIRRAANDDAEEIEPSPGVAAADDDEKGLSESEAAEDLAAIRALLGRDDIGESTRIDLQDFAEDIAQGRFRPADSRYVRALHRRLIG